jgi:hypothetical protein
VHQYQHVGYNQIDLALEASFFHLSIDFDYFFAVILHTFAFSRTK